MVLSILDLGDDIILFHILPQLHHSDVLNLTRIPNHKFQGLFKTPFFYQLLFNKQFNSENVNVTPVGLTLNNWRQLYKLRLNSRLYTWGRNERGRLGLNEEEVPQENRSWLGDVIQPTEVSGFLKNSLEASENYKDIIVTDVSAGGFGFDVLTSNGTIFNIGYRSSRTPLDADLQLRSLLHMNPEHDKETEKVTIKDYTTTEQYAEILMTCHSNNLIKPRLLSFSSSKVDRVSRFISISSGREHLIALDSKNQIWEWLNNKVDWALKVKFIDPATKKNIVADPHKNTVTKIFAGWGYSACYIHGIGIVVWKLRSFQEACAIAASNITDKTPEQIQPADFRIVSNTTASPGSPKQVVDFFLGENVLIYITADGLLHKLEFPDANAFDRLHTIRPYEVLSFNQYLKDYNEHSLNETSNTTAKKFIKIVGNFRTFAVFTNYGDVLIGSRESTRVENFDFITGHYNDESKPTIYPELQNRNCINVALGDYHCLALFANGDLYSWGLESRACGSLGLGLPDEIKEQYGQNAVEYRGGAFSDVRVIKPLKVNLKGKVALAIAANGWQSAAILADIK